MLMPMFAVAAREADVCQFSLAWQLSYCGISHNAAPTHEKCFVISSRFPPHAPPPPPPPPPIPFQGVGVMSSISKPEWMLRCLLFVWHVPLCCSSFNLVASECVCVCLCVCVCARARACVCVWGGVREG